MISKIVLIGLGLVLVAKSQQRAKVEAQNPFNNLDNPTTWGADAYGRLFGQGLQLGNLNPNPCFYNAYGQGWINPQPKNMAVM